MVIQGQFNLLRLCPAAQCCVTSSWDIALLEKCRTALLKSSLEFFKVERRNLEQQRTSLLGKGSQELCSGKQIQKESQKEGGKHREPLATLPMQEEILLSCENKVMR